MTENNARAEVVLYWWEKGMESLIAARRELTAGANEFAINRAYYALFYAVSALLLENGRQFKKHSGVRDTFNKEFIKTGRIEKKYGDLYNQLFDDRQVGDYIALTGFDTEYVSEKIDACEAFLSQLSPMLTSLTKKRQSIEDANQE